jgi:hypothetical protein
MSVEQLLVDCRADAAYKKAHRPIGLRNCIRSPRMATEASERLLGRIYRLHA